MKDLIAAAPMHVPVSTYRLQLNRLFRFEQARELIGYFEDLGIGDCYFSPVLRARQGSLHGYDVTDHGSINPEIGTGDEFRRLAQDLRSRGMGLLLDIVPNHMCISEETNFWWWDVLENGPSSFYAPYFDIDWNPPKEDLIDKVLLPMLDDQYGRVLENREIQVAFDSGTFCVLYRGLRLPVAPRTYRLILDPPLGRLRQGLGPDHPDVLELESILTALSYLPERTEVDPVKIRERQREKEIVKRRLAELAERSRPVLESIEDSVTRMNGSPGDPHSLDRLEELLAEQVYRLSYWRVAADEINYRRFFDINDLAAIRVEDRQVFEAVHALVLSFLCEGLVTGFRVDHPDGLFEPHRYFQDLQAACRAARVSPGCEAAADSDSRRFFVVAEKIVVGDEDLRPWAIEGTTGYGFLNYLNGIFVDRSRRRAFERIYRRFTGWTQSYDDLVYESKKLILQVSMSSELNVLARKLDRISEQHRWSRDFTLESLRDALRETIACFPVYRTYTTADMKTADAEDERHICTAIEATKRRNPAISESIFDFIQSVLLFQDPDGLTEAQREERRLFVMRMQQFTGPVMAKGVEDTAFYRYFPLASLNEVGGEPRSFGIPLSVFHDKARLRLKLWPNAMLPSSTHDTKRGEDVRARINALSEIPVELDRAIRRWRVLNAASKSMVGGLDVPSANEEYLLYQTLLGTWPLNMSTDEEREDYRRRIERYMEKALREAKVHTSWVSPNQPYEEAVSRFIRSLLNPASDNRFLVDFQRLQAMTAWAGMFNSLSQLVLKIASPGVPDFYQGSELWDFSLVDPDNRRPVDFDLHRRLMSQLIEGEKGDLAELVRRLLHNPGDGAIKLYLTRRALRFRKANRSLFAQGHYYPLKADGDRRTHVVAFARKKRATTVIVIAARFFLSLGCHPEMPLGDSVWGGSALPLPQNLPADVYSDIFTGQQVPVLSQGGRRHIHLPNAFLHLPVALLVSEGEPKAQGM
jgi:(1->4)-alpha-D-glucan 1-alpha-D-glucosylmutase